MGECQVLSGGEQAFQWPGVEASPVSLEVGGGAVEVTVWDSNPTPPAILAPDPLRIGRHGLEIVMAVGRSFAVHREPVGKRITTAIVPADDPGGGVC